jgi:hypothetical protein
MKLLVGDTERQARLAFRSLGLTEPEWRWCGVGSALSGYQYDRIVVLPLLYPDMKTQTQEWLEHLRCKLSPGSDEMILL